MWVKVSKSFQSNALFSLMWTCYCNNFISCVRGDKWWSILQLDVAGVMQTAGRTETTTCWHKASQEPGVMLKLSEWRPQLSSQSLDFNRYPKKAVINYLFHCMFHCINNCESVTVHNCGYSFLTKSAHTSWSLDTQKSFTVYVFKINVHLYPTSTNITDNRLSTPNSRRHVFFQMWFNNTLFQSQYAF